MQYHVILDHVITAIDCTCQGQLMRKSHVNLNVDEQRIPNPTSDCLAAQLVLLLGNTDSHENLNAHILKTTHYFIENSYEKGSPKCQPFYWWQYLLNKCLFGKLTTTFRNLTEIRPECAWHFKLQHHSVILSFEYQNKLCWHKLMASSHYLIQCWLFVNSTFKNTLCSLIWVTIMFTQDYAFETVIC